MIGLIRVSVCLFVTMLLSMQVAVGMESKEKIANDLDSLILAVQETYCSGPIGLKNIDRLLEYGYKKQDKEIISYALEYKAGSYVNLEMHDRLDELVDSIRNQTNFSDDKEMQEAYYFSLYTVAMSYIHRDKYKLAIESAQKMYDDSREYAESKPELRVGKDEDGSEKEELYIPPMWSARLSALRCLGSAYVKCNQYDVGIDYLKEGIGICQEYPDFFGAEIIDLKTDRIVAVALRDFKNNGRLPKGKRLSASELGEQESLQLLRQYSNDIKAYNESRDGNSSSAVFYELFQRSQFVLVYSRLNEVEKASYHFQRMMVLLHDAPNWSQLFNVTMYRVIAEYYYCVDNYDMTVTYADSAISCAKNKSEVLLALKLKLLAAQHQPLNENVIDLTDRIIALSDTVMDEKFNSSLDEVGILLGMDKLELKAEKLSAHQRYFMLSAIITLLAGLSVVTVVESRRNREKRRMLAEQKAVLENEVTRQTSELREKNKDITDSINYAKKIQSAILPDIYKYVGHGISGAFVFYRPCEIVSGDFYWAMVHDDSLILACADCTGHGVPGALMSMIGSTILNEICSREVAPEPNEILEELDNQLLSVLARRSDSDVKDGMEISIMKYNTETRTLQLSGARHTTYLFLSGEMIEVKGVRRSIGDVETKSRERKFVTSTFEVKPGDTIYMTTDGIVDQFGGQTEFGPEGSRFGTLRLADTFHELNTLDIGGQRHALAKIFDNWKGSLPQIDDVAVVGIQF